MPLTRLQSLQNQHSELYTQAEELINKPERTDAETTRSLDLINQCKAVKAQIEQERQIERDLGEQRGFRIDPVRDVPHAHGRSDSARVQTRHGTTTMGLSDAGHIRIDERGTTLESVGPGIMGEAAWQAIQDPAYARAFDMYIRKGWNGIGAAERRALDGGLDGTGGVFSPIQFLGEVVQRRPTPTRLAGMVRTITANSDLITMPRVTSNGGDDRYSSPFRVTWGDNPPTQTSVDVSTPTDTFGLGQISIYTAMLSCPLNCNLVDDSGFNVQGWTSGEYSNVRDLLYDDMILNGVGVYQPRGIMSTLGSSNAFNQVPTTNIGSSITADGILDLSGLIEEQYDENQFFFMRKTSTWRKIRKLKDSQNRYLVGMDSGGEAGFGNRPMRTLDGYPVIFSGFMPAEGSGANSVLVGDPRGYYLAQRLSLSVQVLRETLAKQNQVEILAKLRFGGNVVEPWRFRVGVQS